MTDDDAKDVLVGADAPIGGGTADETLVELPPTVVSQDVVRILHGEQRKAVVQAHLNAFLKGLAEEVGDLPLGAFCAIRWQRGGDVTSNFSALPAPPRLLMRMIDELSTKIGSVLSSIKSQINTRPE